MKLLREISSGDMLAEWTIGNCQDTSYEKRESDTQEFTCASCQEKFYTGSKAWIFYSLCDPCFSVWNMRNLESRFSGGPHNVPIEPNMGSD